MIPLIFRSVACSCKIDAGLWVEVLYSESFKSIAEKISAKACNGATHLTFIASLHCDYRHSADATCDV